MGDKSGDLLATDISLIDETSGNRTAVDADGNAKTLASGYSNTSGFSPDPNWTPAVPTANGTVTPTVGPRGELAVRGSVFTDEGSFKDDFLDSVLVYTSTGAATFTNGSLAVTGTGFLSVEFLTKQLFIKASAHTNAMFVQIARINSDTSLTLVSAYAGATATGTFSKSFWVPTSNIASPSLTVADSLLTITGDTTSGHYVGVSRTVDYSPLILVFNISVSQRIANQYAFAGYGGFPGSTFAAFVRWQGTNANYAELVTSTDGSAASTQVTQFTFPDRHTSADTGIEYILDIQRDEVCLRVLGVEVACHKNHIQGPYDTLTMGSGIVNTGVAESATSLALDSMYVANVNLLNTVDVDAGNTDPDGNIVMSTYGTDGPFCGDFTNNPLNPTRWDVYNTGGTFAVSSSSLVVTNPATANINDRLFTKSGFANNPNWTLSGIVEGTRVINSGFVISCIKLHPIPTAGAEHAVHQVAVGLNADPTTGAALAVNDGNTVIRIARRTPSGWDAASVIDITNTSADPFFTNTGLAWNLSFVRSAGSISAQVNGVEVYTADGIDMESEFGLMINSATNATAPLSTATLTVGGICGLEQSEVLIRSAKPLNVLTENADIPDEKILSVRGKMFTATSGSINVATKTETPLLLIRNVSPTLSMYLSDILLDVFTSGTCIFNIYHTPTVTGNGTAITPVNRRIGSNLASTMAVGYSPTVSAPGTLIHPVSVTAGATFVDAMHLATSLKPGVNLLITATVSANNTVVSSTVRYAEL